MSQEAEFRKILPWVAFLSLMFFINYTGRSIIGPLLVYVEQELGLDHSQATGLLMYMLALSVWRAFAPSRILTTSQYISTNDASPVPVYMRT